MVLSADSPLLRERQPPRDGRKLVDQQLVFRQVRPLTHDLVIDLDLSGSYKRCDELSLGPPNKVLVGKGLELGLADLPSTLTAMGDVRCMFPLHTLYSLLRKYGKVPKSLSLIRKVTSTQRMQVLEHRSFTMTKDKQHEEGVSMLLKLVPMGSRQVKGELAGADSAMLVILCIKSVLELIDIINNLVHLWNLVVVSKNILTIDENLSGIRMKMPVVLWKWLLKLLRKLLRKLLGLRKVEMDKNRVFLPWRNTNMPLLAFKSANPTYLMSVCEKIALRISNKKTHHNSRAQTSF